MPRSLACATFAACTACAELAAAVGAAWGRTAGADDGGADAGVEAGALAVGPAGTDDGVFGAFPHPASSSAVPATHAALRNPLASPNGSHSERLQVIMRPTCASQECDTRGMHEVFQQATRTPVGTDHGTGPDGQDVTCSTIGRGAGRMRTRTAPKNGSPGRAGANARTGCPRLPALGVTGRAGLSLWMLRETVHRYGRTTSSSCAGSCWRGTSWPSR